MWTCKNMLDHIWEIYISTHLWIRVHWRTDLRNVTSDMSFSLDMLSMENKIKWNRENILKPLSYGKQEETYNCLLMTPFQEFCLISFHIFGNCSWNLNILKSQMMSVHLTIFKDYIFWPLWHLNFSSRSQILSCSQ